MTHKGIVIQLKRIDTALTKAELINHLQMEHSQLPQEGMQQQTKETLLSLHRIVHWGTGR